MRLQRREDDVRRGLAREAVGALHVVEVAAAGRTARGRARVVGVPLVVAVPLRPPSAASAFRDTRDRRVVSVWPRAG